MRYRTLGDGNTSFDVSTLCLGTMNMGTLTDEETSFAILDRYLEAGGTFLDTANNYSFWAGGNGRDSEDLIARWLVSRGVRDQVRIATKLGAAKKDPALPLSNTPPTNFQGLAAETVAREAYESLRHLGVDRLDVLYGHVDDLDTPLAETVGAFGKLQAEGVVGISGISNVALWRVVEAREEALRQGVAPYGVVQEQLSYLYPTPDPDRHNWASPELLDYARSTGSDERPPLAVTAYSPLLQGAMVRDDKELWEGYRHPTSLERRRVLHEVARQVGATPNQVALAWLLGGPVPVVPVIGPSTVAQLDELLGAADLARARVVRDRRAAGCPRRRTEGGALARDPRESSALSGPAGRLGAVACRVRHVVDRPDLLAADRRRPRGRGRRGGDRRQTRRERLLGALARQHAGEGLGAERRLDLDRGGGRPLVDRADREGRATCDALGARRGRELDLRGLGLDEHRDRTCRDGDRPGRRVPRRRLDDRVGSASLDGRE